MKKPVNINHVDHTPKMILFVSDLIIGIVSYYFSFNYISFQEFNLINWLPIRSYVGLLMVLTVYHALAFIFFNFYRYKELLSKHYFSKLLFTFLGELGVISSILYVLNIQFSKTLILTYLAINYMSLFLFRLIISNIYPIFHPSTNNVKRFVITYGIENSQELNKFKTEEFEIIIPVGKIKNTDPEALHNYIKKLIREKPVDQILIGKFEQYEGLQNIIEAGENAGIPVAIEIGNFTKKFFNSSLLSTTHGSLLELRYHSIGYKNQILKRIVDLTVSLLGTLFVLCLTPLIGLLIKIESKGPVFYRQKRIGRFGRPFHIFKFRTMIQNADELKKSLAKHNTRSGPMFKMSNDPRITKVGQFLRNTHLDELPQLFNVLLGDMSLVGTRPPTVDEVKNYDLSYFKRLTVRPGITGAWQICDKNTINKFDDVIELDFNYMTNWSIMKDIQILTQTFVYIFTGKDE